MKFKQKPVIVEACQVTNDANEAVELVKWIKEVRQDDFTVRLHVDSTTLKNYLLFKVTEDLTIPAGEGDWIVKEDDGRIFPLPQDEFEKIYEELDVND